MKDFLTQMRRLWGDLGLNQRVSIVLAVLATIAGMVALTIWSGRPQFQILYSGVDPKEMSEIVATLQEKEIPHEVSASGTGVSVPSDSIHTARLELASRGIPNGGNVGFEIFDKGNFGVSDFVQRTNYLRAVQGELARTISQLKQVRSARVMVVAPENKYLLADRNSRPTASVFVQTGGGLLSHESVNSIRFLVANAVEGLRLNDVAVVDHHGNVLSQEIAEDSVLGAATGAFKYKASLEDYFTRKVESMLTPVVGMGKVVARVSVDIDQEAQTKVDEIIFPETATVVSQSSTDDSTISSESNPTRVVGADANLPEEGANPATSQVSSSEQSTRNKQQDYAMSRSTVETQRAPGAIRRISASVFLAQRSVENEAGELVPEPRTTEELENLRTMVVNALGIDQNGLGTGEPLVALTEAPFEGDNPLLQGGLEGGNFYQWSEIGQKLFAVGIAVGMFVIFLRLLRKQKPDAIRMEVVNANEEKEQLPDLKDITPSLTPELLNELIRQKPDNVSTALKNWASAAATKK